MKRHGIEIPPDQLAEFCRRNSIRRLSLFGSVLREDFRPDSDIDVLVEFEPGREPGLLGLARMERELTRLLGQAVDLRTPEDLSDRFRRRVMQSADLQYVAA